MFDSNPSFTCYLLYLVTSIARNEIMKVAQYTDNYPCFSDEYRELRAARK